MFRPRISVSFPQSLFIFIPFLFSFDVHLTDNLNTSVYLKQLYSYYNLYSGKNCISNSWMTNLESITRKLNTLHHLSYFVTKFFGLTLICNQSISRTFHVRVLFCIISTCINCSTFQVFHSQ